ncbi:MAG: alpha/beta hydrolase [Gemmataceae bacterium]|nr:alpha/beta hydrolase [Gemmataceae bacterium]
MGNKFFTWLGGIGFFLLGSAVFAADAEIIRVWPGKAPGELGKIGPEKVEPNNPAEKNSTIRLTNVSEPTLTLFLPKKTPANGAAVIVCPGGGHRILAWDKEGTEVAEWLASQGVTAFVLKYRVPARDESRRWLAAVQDAQRAVSLVRSRAEEWKIDPTRLGILGFSAGGETAGLTALFNEKQYDAVDAVDKTSSQPNFAVLVYPGGLTEKDQPKLQSHVRVSKDTPPMFFAHASDDRVTPLNSVLLYAELKKFEVPAELHIYAKGGHGFGLRPSSSPASTWPARCAEWMKNMGFLQAKGK